MKTPFLVPLLQEITSDFSIEIVPFHDASLGGYILLPSKERFYFKSSRWDINPLGGSKVVSDKTLTLDILKESGYIVPSGICVSKFELPQNLKLPVVVKPNSGFKARGLTNVKNHNELEKAFIHSQLFDPLVRIEEEVQGKHISISIFNGKVYSVYEKEPFSAGNIVSDYTEVISKEIKDYIAQIPTIFNLKLASIDCIYKGEGDFSKIEDFVIIEVNSAPSFKKYAEYNETARKNIKLLYTDIIKFIIKKYA